MALFVLRFFSVGRKMNDGFALALCGLPIAFIGFSNHLPTWATATAGLVGAYFLVQVLIRIQTLRNQKMAAKLRSEKSTQWAQSFIHQHLSEIRRPLQGLIGVREIYDFDLKNKETKEYMEIVNHCSEHVVRLINRLQLYSELRSGEYAEKSVRFTLSNILEDSIKAAEANNPGKKVSVDQHISPKVLRDYFGSYDLIRNLVVEIIDNSVRYSPRADIEISAEQSNADDKNLVIRIRDRGPGMQASVQKKLQANFDRQASSFDLKNDQEGMGVPLIRSLADQLSAKINIKSKLGSGTEFEIQLRIPAYSAPAVDINKKQINQKSDQILVVEDDLLAQKIISSMLNRLGYRSTIVSNGHDAVELCRRQKFGFILMDLEMPIMDGWDATHNILENCPEDQTKPVIVALTAHNRPSDKARAKKIGFNYFLSKPVNKNQLQLHLKKADLRPHFAPNAQRGDKKLDSLELMSCKTVDFSKMFVHYDKDMELCQIILNQSMQTLPILLDELDKGILNKDEVATEHCLHQITGELRALLCNNGVNLVERLRGHKNSDNIDYFSDLEQLNHYCESLLRELSVLSKHNKALAA